MAEQMLNDTEALEAAFNIPFENDPNVYVEQVPRQFLDQVLGLMQDISTSMDQKFDETSKHLNQLAEKTAELSTHVDAELNKTVENIVTPLMKVAQKRKAQPESDEPPTKKQKFNCFHCGEEGHFANRCPSKDQPANSRQHDECFKCNQTGHWASDCPGTIPTPQKKAKKVKADGAKAKGTKAEGAKVEGAEAVQPADQSAKPVKTAKARKTKSNVNWITIPKTESNVNCTE